MSCLSKPTVSYLVRMPTGSMIWYSNWASGRLNSHTNSSTSRRTSGTHFPQWAQDGVYEPQNTPDLGQLVHTLEHGRIDVQYKPGTPDHTVKQLEALLAEQEDGYHMLLFQNGTNMDAQVAATAWGHSLTCPQFNNKVFDALRTFRASFIDQGPEDVP